MTDNLVRPGIGSTLAPYKHLRSRELEVGMAGEHLVMFDLLLKGYCAIMADQHCKYDILIDLGTRIARVQVKSTGTPKPERRKAKRSHIRFAASYKWSTRRPGKGGHRKYDLDGFDVLALVALDIKLIAYVKWDGRQNSQIMPPGTMYRGSWKDRHPPGFDQLTIGKALAA